MPPGRSTPNALRPLHLPGLVEPMGDEGVSTQLLAPSGSVCFSYASAPWRLFLRKEVGTRVGTRVGFNPAALGGGRGTGCGGASLGPQRQLPTAHLLAWFCLSPGDEVGWEPGWRGTTPATLGLLCPHPGVLPPGELRPPLLPQAPL